MKLTGIEEHFLTAEIREAWNAIGLDAVDPSVAFHCGTIESRLLDVAEDRLALMDETGLDVQVLSLTTPALHDLGPECCDERPPEPPRSRHRKPPYRLPTAVKTPRWESHV